MLLVILLILFGFWAFLSLPKRNAVALRKSEATQPVKSFSKNVGILQVDLRSAAFASISFAKTVSVIANAYQRATNAASCLAALARAIFHNFDGNKALCEASQGRIIRNKELRKGAKSNKREFRDAIKCTVTVIHCHRNSNSRLIMYYCCDKSGL